MDTPALQARSGDRAHISLLVVDDDPFITRLLEIELVAALGQHGSDDEDFLGALRHRVIQRFVHVRGTKLIEADDHLIPG